MAVWGRTDRRLAEPDLSAATPRRSTSSARGHDGGQPRTEPPSDRLKRPGGDPVARAAQATRPGSNRRCRRRRSECAVGSHRGRRGWRRRRFGRLGRRRWLGRLRRPRWIRWTCRQPLCAPGPDSVALTVHWFLLRPATSAGRRAPGGRRSPPSTSALQLYGLCRFLRGLPSGPSSSWVIVGTSRRPDTVMFSWR